MELKLKTGNKRELTKLAKQVLVLRDIEKGSYNSYMSAFKMFFAYIKKHGVNPNTLIEFKHYLNSQTDKYSISRLNMFMTAARIFVTEVNERGYKPWIRTANIKGFKNNKRHVKDGLKASEVNKLFRTVASMPSTPYKWRLKAILSLLANHGLRQIEVRRLTLDDINLDQGTALIQGKGEDDKEPIFLNPVVITALKKHIKVSNIESGALFPNINNRVGKPISAVHLGRMLRDLFEKAGVKKTPHGLRHHYITELLKELPIHVVQKFSRHRNINTLQAYDDTKYSRKMAKEIFAEINYG